jgi:hypothetical protein
VVDVSVHPGVKLLKADSELRFVPLEQADQLHEVDESRPAQCDVGWRESALKRGRQQTKPGLPEA